MVAASGAGPRATAPEQTNPVTHPSGNGQPRGAGRARGPTSVPGLAAKPMIDIVLAVPDSTDEAAYVPPLQAIGYVLRIRDIMGRASEGLRNES